MTKPRVVATTIQAFSDVVRAARAMPLLMVVAVAASFGHDLLASFTPRVNEPGGLLATLVFGFAWAILMAPVFIGIFRFVILDEVTPDYPLDPRNPRLRVFCAWSIALFLVIEALSMPVTAYWGDDQRLVANAVVIAACGVVIAWAALLFPAVAVDAPGATLRNAIADVHNSFWRALAIQALILLPFLIALIVSVTVIVTALVLTTENSDTAGKMAAKIIHPIWSFVMFSSELVWVAAAGRLFLALAERLQQPVPR